MNYNKKFFSQITIKESIELDDTMKFIDKIVSKVVNVEVISINIIDTAMGTSKEHQYLSGKKAVVEIKIKEKILYSSKDSKENLHILEVESFHNEYITIPNKIEGTDPKVLLEKNMLKVDLILEDVYIEAIDKKTIYKNIFMTALLKPVPTYELCYCVYRRDAKSNLYFMYENGKNIMRVFPKGEGVKAKRLQWTYTTKDIIFISNFYGVNRLYNLNKNNNIRSLIRGKFDSIDYFQCNSKKNHIVFSARIKEEENIFLMNINTMNYKKLTKNKSEVRNFNPKFDHKGDKIAFIRGISGINNIWIIDLKDLKLKKVTNNGYIKSFQWINDGKNIVYIHGNSVKEDKISIVDIGTLIEEDLIYHKNCERLKSLQVSPDGKYISYVNRTCNNDTIFLYDRKLHDKIKLINIEKDYRVCDLIWKIDSTKIYYSVKNDLGCSIKSMRIFDLKEKLLVNYKNAYKIKLSYRPKII